MPPRDTRGQPLLYLSPVSDGPTAFEQRVPGLGTSSACAGVNNARAPGGRSRRGSMQGATGGRTEGAGGIARSDRWERGLASGSTGPGRSGSLNTRGRRARSESRLRSTSFEPRRPRGSHSERINPGLSLVDSADKGVPAYRELTPMRSRST